jgi:hypothetical protein
VFPPENRSPGEALVYPYDFIGRYCARHILFGVRAYTEYFRPLGRIENDTVMWRLNKRLLVQLQFLYGIFRTLKSIFVRLRFDAYKHASELSRGQTRQNLFLIWSGAVRIGHLSGHG